MKRFDHINVIPFIDIMLVMLAIVLTTASFISQNTLDIDVPNANNSQKSADSERQISISIDKNQLIYVQEKQISLVTLDALLVDLPKGMKIILQVDKSIPFQQFVSVLEVLKKRQIKNLSIVTQKTA